ncbi:unnamed protein product, partial [Timema podura]|nr:unnamed protein product [Timema podura]
MSVSSIRMKLKTMTLLSSMLRGLPWSTSVDEIIKFFSDCTVKDGKNGVHMTMSREGRPSGEAYVEMETEEDIERACKKDRDHMGQRYIE